MFEKRTDLVRFLAVAEAGRISVTAERLAITQPTLTRDIARLEHRIGGRLFERLPTGVRLTALGATVTERARRILREIEDAETAVDAARAGRTGVIRISATAPWTETVLGPAAACFHEEFPTIELRLETTTRAEGLRRLADGESELHCGGIDPDEPLPGFLRRERFIELTAGIVAWRGHPLLSGRVTRARLSRYPWIDFDWPASAPHGARRASLDAILERIRGAAPARTTAVLRTGAAGLLLMADGPYLAWLSLSLLDQLPGRFLQPLPVSFGRHRYRSGFVARRAAEDLSPFVRLEQLVREFALGPTA